ncbi:PREDICTED: NADH dehydrogenase [ubiquinone] 1 beta subcomplex subunit 8, mitochondrial-like [Rhagoletis zephyria]|uniref:NADH dehydrogenase [ubiquinone] 1 beta subcomplex subunit 8, mitochondrial-like n=1 Tax=Rhagoletis zephyria TaxID=28612 RepID=UPI000811737C|nr:PREDICTED: NADH dehydrogenase [ubiquinone] 1 beta subcomplex subunit 8, mitochondrial-like [Rhagoletis zephyria]
MSEQRQVHRSSGWVRDYKPGPYPKTQEEREAAARKYNLIPEDYEPYEEGSGYGDYPKLPAVGQDSRDPYEDFDYYYRRRNFGETVHIDYDIHMSEKSNPNVIYRYPVPFMIGTIVSAFAAFFLFGWIDRKLDLRTSNPMKPKQYWPPPPGVKHYTFEPAD